MSPMYNPDDWNKEFTLKLKYEPMDSSKVNQVLIQYKHDEVLNYIKELWNLIDYQRKLISDYNKEIVAFKHKEAWKRYDLPESKYEAHLDKPKRTDTMGC